MINSITNPYASNLLGQYPAQDKNTSSSHDQIAASSSGRVVHDKVDLSPKAAETLEQHNRAQKEAQDKLTSEIMDKGFLAWAAEKQKEKIEAEVRAQVLSSMGLDEDDFANLEAEVQQRIQNLIEEKAREQMEKEVAKNLEQTNTGYSTPL